MQPNETVGPDTAISVVRSTAAADLCSLLALLLQFPTEKTVGGLADGTLRDDIAVIAEELGAKEGPVVEALSLLDRLRTDLAEGATSIVEARREYTRLFNHPDGPAVPLYEGVFIDTERVREGKRSTGARLFVNPAALDAERCYRQAGLKRASDVNIPADCMSTELEFMAYLSMLEAQALVEQNATRVAEAAAWIGEFNRLHVEKWFSRFFERCAEESAHDLYRALGMLGRLVVHCSQAHAPERRAS